MSAEVIEYQSSGLLNPFHRELMTKREHQRKEKKRKGKGKGKGKEKGTEVKGDLSAQRSRGGRR